MFLVPQVTLQAFDKWVVDFVGPINPPRKLMGAHYIIIETNQLTRWDEATPLKDCTVVTTARFLFDHVVTRFRCPQILVSNKGTQFVNKLIDKLTEEFQIQYRKTTTYHP